MQAVCIHAGLSTAIVRGALWLLAILSSFSQVHGQTMAMERSYVNVNKRTTGGTNTAGDTLELRATIVVFSGTTISRCNYRDTVPANTRYVPGSLKLLSNEGVVVASYTDALAGDQAYITGGRFIQFFLGTGATDVLGGSITGGTNTPRFSNATIMMAVYRVVDTSALYTNIRFQGSFAYRYSSVNYVVGFSPITLTNYPNRLSCADYTGASAALDSNGTFGTGITQNRATPAIVPGYTFVPASASFPNDGYYSIVNNTSANGSTNPLTPKPDPGTSRIFGVFDIYGDHTGAANPVYGNPPAAPGTRRGYLLLVNASYQTNAVISQTVSNLCPETYYDFSAWFRNICSLCGSDINGNGTNTPGVKPNLSFEVNGRAYYSSGEIAYDSMWKKKGFVYLTGPGETSLTFTIRNNAPGGGGNDWVMDDVNFAICAPKIQFNSYPYYAVCDGNQVDLFAVVRSHYNNYTTYKWQKSIDGGLSWFNTGISGTATPTLVGGLYQYSLAYPSFAAPHSDSGHKYRIVVATSAANVNNPNCSFTDTSGIITLRVWDCLFPLSLRLLRFGGQQRNGHAELNWQTEQETESFVFEIERSRDGVHFSRMGTVNNKGLNLAGPVSYSFTDIEPLGAGAFYRLRMMAQDGRRQYSSVLFLGGRAMDFSVKALNNPFNSRLDLEWVMPVSGPVQVYLFDAQGRLAASRLLRLNQGVNQVSLDGLGALPGGMYILKAVAGQQTIHARVNKVK